MFNSVYMVFNLYDDNGNGGNMTKAELLNELERYSDNMEVKIYSCCPTCAKERITTIDEVTTTKAKTAILIRIE